MESKITTQISDAQLNTSVGELTEYSSGEKTTYLFTYTPEFLTHPQTYSLDENLVPLAPGSRPISRIPQMIQDTAPDKFGRTLWQRANPSNHSELRLILSTGNEYRKGSLELSGSTTPQHKTLRETESLIRQYTQGNRDVIKQLIDIGSSALGGARAKATISDNGTLYVAKFPQEHDRHGTVQDEVTATNYMKSQGISTAEVYQQGGVFFSKRFDRIGKQKLGFVSLASLTGLDPSETHDYIDVVDFLNSAEDKQRMFYQVAVNTILHNSDDHLNNWGMLRTESGWQLSPAYDINAHEDIRSNHANSLNGETSAEGTMSNLAEFAQYVDIPQEEYTDFMSDAFNKANALKFSHLNMKERVKQLAPFARLETSSSTASLCSVCGRPLTDPESIARGAGKKCAGLL